MSPSDNPHRHSLAAPFMPSLCVSLYSNIVLLSACQCLSPLCVGHSITGSLLCLSVVLYSSTNNAFFLWQHSDLGWSVCLPTTLWCLLVCHCMFRAGRVDVNGGLQQVRRGCVVSPGRSVFRCPLVGAESDSCGRNGRWNGLIFRHNRVHVQTQGAVLWKSSPRGVYPAHFPLDRVKTCVDQSAQLISRWMLMGTLLCRQMTRMHPVASFTLNINSTAKLAFNWLY